jgi:hypothetical protein
MRRVQDSRAPQVLGVNVTELKFMSLGVTAPSSASHSAVAPAVCRGMSTLPCRPCMTVAPAIQHAGGIPQHLDEALMWTFGHQRLAGRCAARAHHAGAVDRPEGHKDAARLRP